MAAGAGSGADTSLLFPFVFVGCWNQPGVVGKYEVLPRDYVAEAIRKMTDIQYIVLGGDNVYPRPLASGEKNKKHETSVIDEGIRLYAAARKPILGAFGNHNVDTIAHQLSVFGLEKTYYQRIFAGNIHMLVLDTNIVLTGSTDPEYQVMCMWFAETVAIIQKEGHRYFVVQHEPYFTARSKGFGSLINADPLLNTMFTYPPIAVLCADTHHYQHATIQRPGAPTIHQFIVGTGGAKHDPHMVSFTEPKLMNDMYVFTQVRAEPGFGFLRVTDTDPSHFKFIKVLDWPLAGGAHRARATHRRRIKHHKPHTRKHPLNHILWRNVRNQIGGYSVNNARLYENTRWGQLGGHRIDVGGIEYNWRGSRNGEFVMYRIGPKTECALLLTDRDEAGDLFGILQNVRNGSNCSASPYATTKDLMKAVWNLAYGNNIRYIEFSDESKVICPTKERVSLSALYFLTYGKTWYESVWPIIPTYPELIDSLREHVLSVSWDAIYLRLKPDAKAHFLPAYPGIDPTEPGSANKVMRYLMSMDWCKSIGKRHADLLLAFDVSGIHNVTWRTVDITRTV